MSAGGILGKGEGLVQDKGVVKKKLHCTSIEGLLLKTAEQAVQRCHLGVLEVRKGIPTIVNMLVVALASRGRAHSHVNMTWLFVLAGRTVVVS